MPKTEKNMSTKGAMGKILRYIRKYWFFVGVSIVLAALTVALTFYKHRILNLFKMYNNKKIAH